MVRSATRISAMGTGRAGGAGRGPGAGGPGLIGGSDRGTITEFKMKIRWWG